MAAVERCILFTMELIASKRYDVLKVVRKLIME